jgi:hypothetical protein
MKIGLLAIGILVILGFIAMGLYWFVTNVRFGKEKKQAKLKDGYVEFGTTPPFDIPKPTTLFDKENTNEDR